MCLAPPGSCRSRQHCTLLAPADSADGMQWPGVKIALHAGELTYDLVAPDDLRFHVRDAVRIAGANRIGHGVALQWEDDSKGTLKYMRDNKVSKGATTPAPWTFSQSVPVCRCL